MSLKAEPEWAGKVVRCPGCNTKLQIPENIGGAPAASSESPSLSSAAAFSAPAPDHDAPIGAGLDSHIQRPERHGWKESDPMNPNGYITFAIGVVLTLAWFGVVYPFQAPAAKIVADYTSMETVANVFYKHFLISFINTLFFFLASAILYLKLGKLKHQREALILDILPGELGREINGQNVAYFIDHLYNLPARLRDSMMVNRIRKALELFEVRQNTPDVGSMMASQSNIDGARIGGSYIMLKAFLWAIPLMGFIGTVIGLSHAIAGMSFSNMDDVSAIVGSISSVTSGLGTAFDATLLGLVLAVGLNFPMNALAKNEDEMLNEIDAFCNEVLLPRLNDGAGAGGGDVAAIADSVMKGLSSAQKEFLVDLNELSKRMNEYAANLDKRSDAFQQVVTKEFINNTTQMRTEMQESLKDSLKVVSQYMGALETGVRGLNTVLKELGEKQVVIQQVKKKGWFGRD
ncbi:MAG TPA: MotA/TolQ/ExbB proton channel family protein [Verrucomicrobium sp.]|nr:MotA/TolQ/ExbB proton channel family protein [Verrucomicrobium sp.]